MKKIIMIFIGIFVLDTVVFVGCKSKSSIKTLGLGECESLNEYITSFWNSPSLVANTTLTDDQYATVFASENEGGLGVVSALFDSAKYSRIKSTKDTISDIECKINSLNNGGEDTKEECSNRYICPNCGLGSLNQTLSEYKTKLTELQNCSFDSSRIDMSEISEDQNYAVYSTLLVNNSASLNDEFVDLWIRAVDDYSRVAFTDEEKAALKLMIDIATNAKNPNSHIYKKAIDTGYKVSQISKLCSYIVAQAASLKSIKDNNKVGFCIKCISGLQPMCAAALKDTEEFVKSKVVNEEINIQGYIDNFIRQVVTSIVICTAKKVFKETWTTIGKKVREFVMGGQKKVIEEAKEKSGKSDILHAVVSALCEAGFGFLGDVLSMEQAVNYNSPCKSVFTLDKTKLASCSRTISTICPIFLNSGYVDLHSFLPDTNKDLLLNMLYDIGGVAVTGLCKSGGQPLGMLCTTIAAAASQIKTAILTGNNDWAHCLGTDQMGACVGTKWAEFFAGMSLSYAQSAVEKLTPDNNGGFYGDMCLCERSCYEDKALFDNKYKTENVFNYAGDVKDISRKYSDCKSFNGRRINHGVPAKSGAKATYAKYSNCKLVSVSFKNTSNQDASLPLDGTLVHCREYNQNGTMVYGIKDIVSQSYEGCVQ